MTGRVSPPFLDDLAVVTWNAHLAEGRLTDLIADLRAGRVTDGRPVHHFVLLLQELFRRGPDVPVFSGNQRTAYAIRPRDPRAPDVVELAQSLGLSLLYVPSMRNGADMLEDRGNAIISSEPLRDPFAAELPLERQRRVAIGSSIDVRSPDGAARLNLLSVHLEPLSAPSSLWVFRNPRTRQTAALLALLRAPRFEPPHAAGTVVGGDFNTIQGGVDEDAYEHARRWSTSLLDEDRRKTHYLGRIDYLFFRLAEGWVGATRRIDETFGSDHHPVVGRIVRLAETP